MRAAVPTPPVPRCTAGPTSKAPGRVAFIASPNAIGAAAVVMRAGAAMIPVRRPYPAGPKSASGKLRARWSRDRSRRRAALQTRPPGAPIAAEHGSARRGASAASTRAGAAASARQTRRAEPPPAPDPSTSPRRSRLSSTRQKSPADVANVPPARSSQSRPRRTQRPVPPMPCVAAGAASCGVVLRKVAAGRGTRNRFTGTQRMRLTAARPIRAIRNCR